MPRPPAVTALRAMTGMRARLSHPR